MERDKMVSIIIPFNNGKKYLYRCLENLKNLKYEDFEIILIDDFSEDNSEELAKKYADDLRIKYYYTNEKTVGVGAARNLGIEKATGKYIMFIDVDDTIDENLLRNLEQYMKQNIEMVKYKMKIIKDGKEFLTQGNNFDKIDGQDGFNKLCFSDKFLDSPCLYLIKKELFDRTKLKFTKNTYHEDFGLIPQLIINAKSIVSVNYYGYNYFQSDNSIMRDNDYSKELKKMEDKFLHYENLIKNIESYNLTKTTKDNLLTYYSNSIIIAVKDLKKLDRKFFENKIKEKGLAQNIKPKNFKQLVKKGILITNLEVYYKILGKG